MLLQFFKDFLRTCPKIDRKNSKNKTMNNNFISEIFSSEQFCQDYQKYLENFSSILQADNTKKINKLVAFIEECLTKNAVHVQAVNRKNLCYRN